MAFVRILLFLLVYSFFAALASANDYYVAPNGTANGNGSLSAPWNLQTALNQPASVKPGDTIWVLGGTYRGNFTSTLNGTATSPITVRNYQGQRATLDGTGCEALVLSVNGSYAWYWGLEVIDSTGPRISTGPGICKAFGIGVYGGPGDKFINDVVHDTSEGFSAYNASPDSEFYGNLSFYNGYIGSDRNYGHGFYLQNITGTKIVSDNFVGDNGFEGIQIYGSGSASLVGFTVVGNVFYDTDSWPTPNNFQYNLIIAGGATRQNITVQNNYSYFPLTATSGYVSLGGYTNGLDMTIQNNVIVGGYTPFAVNDQAGPVNVTGNTIYASPASLRLLNLILAFGQTLGQYAWDNNTYYDGSPYGLYDAGTDANGNVSGANYGISDWLRVTTFDAHSTYTHNAPTGTWVYVRPNKYETKRANIVIYNWALSATVAVDLSGVLVPGDQYVIQDAQNFYGPPVAKGTYAGGTVSVPMTGLTKAPILGTTTPPHTAPQFGTFVVMPVNVSASPLPPTNLTATVE